MTTNSTRWRVSPVAWVPIALAIVAEAVSNALRAYGLGAHLDRFTVVLGDHPVSLAGAVLVCAAVAVSLTQARAAWVALTPGALRQRIVSGMAALLLLAVSITAMASHILEAGRAKVADENSDRGRFERALSAYEMAKSEQGKLAGVRSIEAVRAAMDAAPVSRSVFARTKQCTEVTREDSFAACKPILDLRQEMAGAIRKVELDAKVPALKSALDRLPAPEKASASEEVVAGIWAWIMGLAVVLVATFGTVIFARVDTATPAASTASAAPALLPEPASAPTAPRAKPRKRKVTERREKVVAWVRAYTLEHGHPPSFKVVKGRFHLPKATASRLRRAAIEAA